MGLHNFMDKMSRSHLNSTGQTLLVPGTGYMLGWGTTVGNGLQGWAKGALFIDLDASSGAQHWVNTGTITTATWKAQTSLDAANTWAALQTFTLGAAISTADLLTVGGLIVPQEEIVVSQTISLHASKVTYNLFVARDAWQVTKIDFVPDIAQGGALTGTVVKAVTTATPASATTPMHTANAIDHNATAHTVQPITLTATTADLQLAAGNRIGYVLNAALTVGSGLLTIKAKRI